MFAFAALASLWEVALAIQGYGLTDRAANGIYASDAELNGYFESANSADGLVLLALVGTAIAFIAWLSRSVENVPPLGGGVPSESPRYAIGWWFVPIAFLWKPYTVVRDTWDRLAPTGRASGGGLVVAWWIAWIAGGMLGRVVQSLANASEATLDDAKTFFSVAALSQLMLVGSAICAFFVVREMQRRADERALALGLEAPTAQWPVAAANAIPGVVAQVVGASSSPTPVQVGDTVRYCPRCGASRVRDERFCAHCGADLSVAATH
jgi:hypothetical protein